MYKDMSVYDIYHMYMDKYTEQMAWHYDKEKGYITINSFIHLAPVSYVTATYKALSVGNPAVNKTAGNLCLIELIFKG